MVKQRPGDIKIIFPLNVESEKDAKSILTEAAPYVNLVMVGSMTIDSIGLQAAIALPRQFGKDVVSMSFSEIADMNELLEEITASRASYFTIKASGGTEFMKEARKISSVEARKVKDSRPRIIANVKQGSWNGQDLKKHRIAAPKNLSPDSWSDHPKYASFIIRELTEMAVDAGMDYVLTSSWEVAALHEEWPMLEFFCNGVCLPDVPRVQRGFTKTPGEAVKAGASNLIINWPINNPLVAKTTRQIVAEIRADIAQALGE